MLAFTQEEVERELADSLPHGSRVEVARLTGLSESTIKRQFNPDDADAVSCAFRILQIGCALDAIDEDKLGEPFWATIARFRQLSKNHRNRPKQCDHAALDKDTGRLGKEVSEFIAARLEGKSIDAQYCELNDIRTWLDRIELELVEEFQEEKETEKETNVLRAVS